MIRMQFCVIASLALFGGQAFAQEGEELGANWGGEGGKMAVGEVGASDKGQVGKAVYEDLLKVADRDPPKGTPVVWARLFPVAKRWEASLGFEMSVIDKYSKHNGGKLNATYHFNELLALNLFGGYLHGQPNGLLEATLNDGTLCETVTLKNCLPDTNIMSWLAGADFVVEPFYGKLNLVSELAINFDIFLGAGGGVTGREGFVSAGQWVKDATRKGVSPFFTAMAGVRLWVVENVFLRVEARDYTWFADRKYLELNQIGLEKTDLINTWTMMFGIGATL